MVDDTRAAARPFWIVAGITTVTASLYTVLVALPSDRGLDPFLLLVVWAVPLFAAGAAVFRGRPTRRGPARLAPSRPSPASRGGGRARRPAP
jgi:hypothetical protein